MNGITSCFTGRLGRDPEQRYTSTGKAMLTLNVAVDQDQRQTHASPEAETTWCRVVVWGDPAMVLSDQLYKGSLVYCEGRLTLERWKAQDGSDRSGFSLSAWVCQPMGQIGRRAPDCQDWQGQQGEQCEPVGVGARAGRDELQDLSF
jgi:single-strand DNA-binding protein